VTGDRKTLSPTVESMAASLPRREPSGDQLVQLREFFYIINKAHAQHLIGFIQHQPLDIFQLQTAPVKQVYHPSWRSQFERHVLIGTSDDQSLDPVEWQNF